MVDLNPPVELAPINSAISSEDLGHQLGSKRQRRPSVRLGDVGEQSAAAVIYEAYVRRIKQWNLDSKYSDHALIRDSVGVGKGSKKRPLTNLRNGDCHETLENTLGKTLDKTLGKTLGKTLDKTLESDEKNGFGEGNLDLAVMGIGRRGKDSKGRRGGVVAKRARSNWVSKTLEGGGGGGSEELGFRDLEIEGSESPLKDQCPMENTAFDLGQDEREGMFPSQRRMVRARVLESKDHDPVELDEPSDTDARDWKSGTSGERNGLSDRRCGSLEDGVRMWLNGLGLGQYAPVFEIHEVDEEVLPLLTLEDLKDMGINAVGSRRKMYSAIQKLGKCFT
ncbi:uncharacterized protein LOC143890886 [Tasmannia lanceolata]|uniref:uncharacterized protein LOC143890886 n=1 Tax=Tasmannia lanceolata TaxID=3420 RepID=UPI0040646397